MSAFDGCGEWKTLVGGGTGDWLATVRIGALWPVTTIAIVLGSDALVGRHVIDRFHVILDHGQSIHVEP